MCNKKCIIKREWLNWFIKKENYYTPLEKDEYYKRFGIIRNEETNEYYVDDNKKEKSEKLYERIWQIRNFEIEKYWTRVAYFWGFIVLVFGGYISVITSNRLEKLSNLHIDLLLLLLGLLFSLSWYLVSIGSKAWQLNWETHIDWLENYIDFPIYKTIFYKNNKFYSVSKINEIMALIILCVWIGLIIQNLLENYTFFGGTIDWFATIYLFLTIIAAIVLLRGYPYGDYKSKDNSFIDRWE
jgi:vacuolar-type H+-ATPase subunit I/STV1